ncbi:hypothetical protein H6G91_17450 [Nostoc muscorum FACHB-395]|nr:hypothetical protein [Desmonostoc muscorum FACHB-395]
MLKPRFFKRYIYVATVLNVKCVSVAHRRYRLAENLKDNAIAIVKE